MTYKHLINVEVASLVDVDLAFQSMEINWSDEFIDHKWHNGLEINVIKAHAVDFRGNKALITVYSSDGITPVLEMITSVKNLIAIFSRYGDK